ncbi:UDP-N-acetylmuramoyl-L-alanyl-D-glutamate--2,6-diaminopimelate ligase [Candidatus Gracilibacteria bacterium]|nr:UDP-N-acetylmuramoyl-L-alanyl-D-glutamate--2,6-diaminopimelate ligase [Candidatus Gracilibacteria bacterium]
MIEKLKKLIPLDSPLRLTWHYLMGWLAYTASGNPAKEMIVIGVTGTKGKTTTCNLIAKGLIANGKKVAMFTTVNMIIGDIEEENALKMTTPSPWQVWEFIRRAQNAGCEYLIMETSSHALFYHRVHGLRYDVAVMTNISQDHLDLHRTMENYVETKLLLFKNLYKYGIRRDVRKVGVVNIDSEYSAKFLSKDIVVDAVHTYGISPRASIRAENIETKDSGLSFDVRMSSSKFHIDSKLQGEFNVMNILAASAVLISQKVPLETITKTISLVGGVPGRLEEVPNLRGGKIFVDYAHTEESLRSVLDTVKKIEGVNRVIVLFGATGDRDKTKRPKMGRIADIMADVIILTDDDTYSEDSLAIIRGVTEGISRREGENFWIVPDREDAIRTALLMLHTGDVLLAAGKGAETVLVTQSGPVPWNDRKVIERILMEIESQVIAK